MKIGELERRTGVSQRLLRYYEEQELLRPLRRSSGYREYRESDVTTVAHIRNLLAAGLSTTTIGELLPCMTAEGPKLIADCPELLLDLDREHARLTACIAELETARRSLEGIIATAPPEARRAADELAAAG
ncbi:MerR family transcriptional regulator [Pseudonocardia sp. TRM90224]|uniref:MerR family transcriptional regulator n=1 Tax=Pseudonocardia sp. TRM90224 TaxID=2812678 RepID=UPI001E3E377F|nr:MerR family transcriptional regulator [Pseudonocardia sp. TRM90224]